MVFFFPQLQLEIHLSAVINCPKGTGSTWEHVLLTSRNCQKYFYQCKLDSFDPLVILFLGYHVYLQLLRVFLCFAQRE